MMPNIWPDDMASIGFKGIMSMRISPGERGLASVAGSNSSPTGMSAPTPGLNALVTVMPITIASRLETK